MVLLVRQKPVAPVHDCQAASKVWQTCICRLVLAVVLLTARTFPMVVFLIVPPAMLGMYVV
eukprot:5925802-Pyramimonas_sp.AAC.1